MQVTTTHTRWKRRPHTHTMQVKSTHTHTHNASENHTHTHTSAGMQQLLPNGHLKAAQQRSTGRLRANKEPSCSFGQLHLGSLLDHGIHSCLRALLTATRGLFGGRDLKS
ncbi:hypothetical protein PMIN03_006172 [Paraphaeosphaeria minitans]